MHDNFVMVSHANIVSIHDLNARTSHELIWRHLVSEKQSDIKDHFKICRSDIRLLKYREKDGELPPRMVILHRNNTIVLLMRDQNLMW